MGLLSRLRAWIGGAFGADESADSTADAGETAEDDADEEDGGGTTGLDPSGATETRTAATDDAVDALRDVRRSQEGSPGDGDADESAESIERDVPSEPDGTTQDDTDADDRDVP